MQSIHANIHRGRNFLQADIFGWKLAFDMARLLKMDLCSQSLLILCSFNIYCRFNIEKMKNGHKMNLLDELCVLTIRNYWLCTYSSALHLQFLLPPCPHRCLSPFQKITYPLSAETVADYLSTFGIIASPSSACYITWRYAWILIYGSL